MTEPTDRLAGRLEGIRRAMAAVANDRPTPEQIAEWNASDRAMAQRIRAAVPGVPLHHAYAVLRALRVRERLDAAAAPAVSAGVAPATDRECVASISGRCLAEGQSETACDTDAGECVHGGKPATDQPGARFGPGEGVHGRDPYYATTDQAAPVCKFDEGCHRVVACDPGCGAPLAATDRAVLRKPAYDAVFAYLRKQPVDFLPVTVVGRNAMIWHAVHAALDAVLPAPAEEHRLALSDALGLGTGAPWDAIHDRATELGLPPLDQDPVARRLGLVAEYRATVLRDFLWRLEQSAGDATAEKFLDDNPELRRMAAESAPALCAECGHPEAVHEDGEDPVSPGRCTACPDGGEDWHNWEAAEPAPAVAQQPEVVHGCPPDGSGLTPCCGRTPFELPLTDRISSEAPITCTGPAAAQQPREAR